MHQGCINTIYVNKMGVTMIVGRPNDFCLHLQIFVITEHISFLNHKIYSPNSGNHYDSIQNLFWTDGSMRGDNFGKMSKFKQTMNMQSESKFYTSQYQTLWEQAGRISQLCRNLFFKQFSEQNYSQLSSVL